MRRIRIDASDGVLFIVIDHVEIQYTMLDFTSQVILAQYQADIVIILMIVYSVRDFAQCQPGEKRCALEQFSGDRTNSPLPNESNRLALSARACPAADVLLATRLQ